MKASVYVGLAVLAAWSAIWGIHLHAQTAATPTPGAYYSNPDNLESQDVAAIETAEPQGTVSLAAFSLTDQAIVDALADRAAHGVTVRIYLDRGELQAGCRGDAACARIPLGKLIGMKGVEIKVKRSKVLMHLKSYAVEFKDAQGYDTFLVRDGSANFSPQGEHEQDNSVTFTTDIKATLAFAIKFRTMWDRPDNLTVAQALEGK